MPEIKYRNISNGPLEILGQVVRPGCTALFDDKDVKAFCKTKVGKAFFEDRMREADLVPVSSVSPVKLEADLEESMTKVVELEAEVDELGAENTELKAKVVELEAENKKLKAKPKKDK